MVKVNDRYEFENILDLSKYLVVPPEEPLLYELHAILIHSGTTNLGHYFAFIRPQDEWVKFNDENVERVITAQAFETGWGGENETLFITEEGTVRLATNYRNEMSAYMLVYTRSTDRADILSGVGPEDIP
jgi:ubiquitin carboxyl-terminal hydrolase 7